MELKIILSIVYIILYGLTIIQGTWSKSGICEKPLLYNSVVIDLILSMGFILWNILSLIMLIFISWELTLILFVSGIVFGKLIYYRLSEFLIILPIYKILTKNYK
jgi:hypothetical protein